MKIITEKSTIPKGFMHGIRIILFIARTKDGWKKDGKPITRRYVTSGEEQFVNTHSELVLEAKKHEYPIRIYSSVNQRDFSKAIHMFHSKMVDVIHSNMDQKFFFLEMDNMFVSSLGSPQCRMESNFLFDIDHDDKYDVQEVLKILENHVEKAILRETPNGHHIITQPFNYKLTPLEPKTDAMILLN